MTTKKFSGWGQNPIINAQFSELRLDRDFNQVIKDHKKITIRGQGRSYGDSSLGEYMVLTKNFDNILYFDELSGILECDSGITLDEIIRIFVPKGWFPPVTPGTRYVSLGGMLASDVHGKNHHKVGSFSNH